MWKFASGQALSPDIERLAELINASPGLFEPGRSVVAGRAPGRLDLMGGIADYSGSLVLQLPLAAASYVAAQAVDEPAVTIASMQVAGPAHQVRYALEELAPRGRPLGYAEAHQLLTSQPERRWTAYVAGVIVALQREHGAPCSQGLRLLVDSQVPAGKGVSSSAALEVATLQALSSVYGLSLNGRDSALLCQRVENLIVGAPCGIMDQMTSACGEQGRLLALLCQPAELQQAVALPEGLEVWAIDSGIRHEVSGADYTSVRVGAFMGYRIVAELAGLPVRQLEPGLVAVDDQCWHGYLANISPSEWARSFAPHIPALLSGAEFLRRYGGTSDPVTRVDPQRSYQVRQAAAHPVYENYRVQLFRALLERPHPDDGVLSLLGELMYQSHDSYSACGLGSSGTDQLVELVRSANRGAGLFGAKITGGGSGGCVAVLARRAGRPAIERVAELYRQESGRTATLLGGSSAGAQQCGPLRFDFHGS